MSRRSQPSILRSLIGMAATLAFALVMIQVFPKMAADSFKVVYNPEASGGPFTKVDAQQCHAAYDAVSAFPGKDAPNAQKVALGISGDVATARGEAAIAAATFAAVARSADAPASAAALESLAATLDAAAATFAAPMTETEFRTQMSAIRTATSALNRWCRSIDEWNRNHLKQ